MRASPQDLVHAHALATVAPVDLCDFYVSAATATIKPPIDNVDAKQVFQPENYITLRCNKTIEELGLDSLGFFWGRVTVPSNSERSYLYYKATPYPFLCDSYYVCCRETTFVMVTNPSWSTLKSLLDNNEYFVVNMVNDCATDILGVIKLPA